MSQKTNNTNEMELRIHSPMQIRQKFYLYILRYTTTDEKFKIKAYINNDIKYTFQRMDPVDERSTNSPYIYRADLDLIIDNQGRLFCPLQEGLLPIEYYQLRLSRKIFNTDTTFRDYNDEKSRSIDKPYSTTHYFIFDVDFTKNLVDSPPGKNLFLQKYIKKSNFFS
jgi:hypothetical protein